MKISLVEKFKFVVENFEADDKLKFVVSEVQDKSFNFSYSMFVQPCQSIVFRYYSRIEKKFLPHFFANSVETTMFHFLELFVVESYGE